MPYVITSRKIKGGHGVQGDWPAKVNLSQSGVQYFANNPVSQGIEKCWSYRTSLPEDQQRELSRDLSGEQLRLLVRHDQEFELDKYGNVTVTGERASDSFMNPYDRGHNFRLLRSSHITAGVDWKVLTPGNTGCASGTSFTGPVWLGESPTLPWPTPITWTDSGESTTYYQRANRALVRLAPMAPSAALSRLIGELLQEGLPKLSGLAIVRSQYATGNGIHSAVAGEYLNYTFGVAPTLQDLKKINGVINKTINGLSKYRKNLEEAKYCLHRKTTLLSEKSVPTAKQTDVILGIGRYPAAGWSNESIAYSKFFVKKNLSAPSTWAVAPGHITDVVTRRVWLECEFEVYVEDLLTFIQHSKNLFGYINKILGGEFTAQTIYDVTPWTWLVGWFSDLSGILGRAEFFATHDVVIRYGYIMHEYKASRLIGSNEPYHFLNGREYWPPTKVVETTSKSRWRATPYGFGLNVASFGAARWAILAALGYTRGAGILNYKE